jgi:hypothetical protein
LVAPWRARARARHCRGRRRRRRCRRRRCRESPRCLPPQHRGAAQRQVLAHPRQLAAAGLTHAVPRTLAHPGTHHPPDTHAQRALRQRRSARRLTRQPREHLPVARCEEAAQRNAAARSCRRRRCRWRCRWRCRRAATGGGAEVSVGSVHVPAASLREARLHRHQAGGCTAWEGCGVVIAHTRRRERAHAQQRAEGAQAPDVRIVPALPVQVTGVRGNAAVAVRRRASRRGHRCRGRRRRRGHSTNSPPPPRTRTAAFVGVAPEAAVAQEAVHNVGIPPAKWRARERCDAGQLAATLPPLTPPPRPSRN